MKNDKKMYFYVRDEEDGYDYDELPCDTAEDAEQMAREFVAENTENGEHIQYTIWKATYNAERDEWDKCMHAFVPMV